jgi:beta-N-acetylhexosaminidase
VLYHSAIPEKYKYSEADCVVKLGSQKDQIAFMTGQMLLIGFYGTTVQRSDDLAKKIRNGSIGGVVVYERNISPDSSVSTLKTLITDLQANAPIPLFITIDEGGGKVNRLKTKYGFPPTVSASYLGNINSLDSTQHYAESTAKTLHGLGINVNFAPVADLCSNPNNPVIAGIERCYSDNPKKVFAHNKAVIAAHHKYQVTPVLKHFPGHGSSTNDSHLGVVDVSKSWKQAELIPYQMLLDQGLCSAIMTAHIINAQLDSSLLPATLSYEINQKLLRDSLGFDGLIFSDDLQMKAISEHFSLDEILMLTINSGVDVLMFSHNIEGTTDHSIEDIHQTLIKLVMDDWIEYSRIQESYDRISRLKQQLK